jgi:hypothetical protein
MIGLNAATIECDGAGRRQVNFPGGDTLGEQKLGVPRRLSFLQNHEQGFFASFSVAPCRRQQSKSDDVLRFEIEAGDVGSEAEPGIPGHDWGRP